MPEIDLLRWREFLQDFPDAHLLQTPEWGELKGAFGWQPIRVIGEDHLGNPAGAQILLREVPFGFSFAYMPMGPVGNRAHKSSWRRWAPLWSEIDRLCRQRRVVFLKVEPDMWEQDDRSSQDDLSRFEMRANFIRNPVGVQPPRTLIINLEGSEESLLARMKQKTRYNIRLALKKGVVIRPSADVEAFYQLITQTAQRDAFGVHTLDYYRMAYELFAPQGDCILLFAESEGAILAGLMAFARGQRAWYFYGASSDVHRERMPNYLLQWEAMRWARKRGCLTYDLWGVPDYDEHELEARFNRRRKGLWGVYRFKRGFGGELQRISGPWDRVYRPVWYMFYRLWTQWQRWRQG